MTRNLSDLLIVSVLAVAMLALALLGWDGGVLRLVLGLLLVLVLPGYALTAALFPDPTLPRTDRLLYTVGLSLVVTILGGFVLNWTPWGLRAQSWAVLLSYITLGGCVAAVMRRPVVVVAPQRSALRLSPGQAALFALAALTLVGSVAIARSEAAQHPAPDVVQLWILPGDQLQTARLGVITKGPTAGSYRLVVQRGGYTIREWPALTLKDDDRWEATIEISARQPGSGPIQARLYRADEPNAIYRSVTLWPDDSPSPNK
ncbi:MAG TPA: DUF1616 domain-containing protein [Herpetosiphonaceae bacterium]